MMREIKTHKIGGGALKGKTRNEISGMVPFHLSLGRKYETSKLVKQNITLDRKGF